MTTVGEILDFVETLAPEYMKMDWDNVGLLLGSRTKPVTKILVALDPFEDVAQEATDWGAELIVTHHPLFFRPARNLTDESGVGRTALLLAAHGISAINAHTNLDCAPDGVNDVLARTLGLENIRLITGNGGFCAWAPCRSSPWMRSSPPSRPLCTAPACAMPRVEKASTGWL